jgi:GNAT superfamily N-acetyltransferase
MTPDQQSSSVKWKPEGLRAESTLVGGGIYACTAFARNSSYLVGTTWVRACVNSGGETVCEIIDIYVPEFYRRAGVGTWMLNMLLDSYGILKTDKGTDAGGMDLMIAMGWKQNPETFAWYLRKEKAAK